MPNRLNAANPVVQSDVRPSGPQSPLGWLITGVIIMFLGLGLFGLGVGIALHQRAFLAGARHASATIVGEGWKYAAHDDEPSPIFAFADGAGKTWRVTAPPDRKAKDYHLGQSVDVFYPPADPTQAELGGFDNLWSLSLLCVIVSLIPLGTGFWTTMTGRRRMRQMS